jgi:hypothetical protein
MKLVFIASSLSGLSWSIQEDHGWTRSSGLSWFIMVYHGLSWFIMVYVFYADIHCILRSREIMLNHASHQSHRRKLASSGGLDPGINHSHTWHHSTAIPSHSQSYSLHSLQNLQNLQNIYRTYIHSVSNGPTVASWGHESGVQRTRLVISHHELSMWLSSFLPCGWQVWKVGMVACWPIRITDKFASTLPWEQRAGLCNSLNSPMLEALTFWTFAMTTSMGNVWRWPFMPLLVFSDPSCLVTTGPDE